MGIIFIYFIKPLLYLMAVNFFLAMAEDYQLFRRAPRMKNQTSRQEIEVREILLQPNRQITVSLTKGEPRLFFFFDGEKESHFVSLTLSPCSSAVKWSLSYRPKNDSYHERLNFTEIMSNNARGAVFVYEGTDSKTVTMNDTYDGLYALVVDSVEKDAKATIYVTMEPGGPYEITIAQDSKLTVTPGRRNRLNVKWEPRYVNVRNTRYCLVVNTKKNYTTLCGAEDEFKNLAAGDSSFPSELRFKKRKNGKKFSRFQQVNNDTVIACVNNKTSLTLTKMKPGMEYYLSLFAINALTNMTVPYGSTSIVYNYTVKQITLRDGHRRTVNLKKHEGRIFFKFKAFKSTKELNFYILVCGGSVRAEVKRKGKKEKFTVDGYRKFVFNLPYKGEEFYLKIDSLDLDDELNRIKYVEVFATQYPHRKYPFPMLPEVSNIYEYESRRECDSVMIGWIPSYDLSPTKYCVWVRENLRFDYEDKFREYFQCNWDKLLKTSRYVNATQKNGLKSVVCQEVDGRNVFSNKGIVTTHEVDNLEPGRSYTIQITVTKKHGRTLSYKLLKVYTKHVCDNR